MTPWAIVRSRISRIAARPSLTCLRAPLPAADALCLHRMPRSCRAHSATAPVPLATWWRIADRTALLLCPNGAGGVGVASHTRQRETRAHVLTQESPRPPTTRKPWRWWREDELGRFIRRERAGADESRGGGAEGSVHRRCEGRWRLRLCSLARTKRLRQLVAPHHLERSLAGVGHVVADCWEECLAPCARARGGIRKGAYTRATQVVVTLGVRACPEEAGVQGVVASAAVTAQGSAAQIRPVPHLPDHAALERMAARARKEVLAPPLDALRVWRR